MPTYCSFHQVLVHYWGCRRMRASIATTMSATSRGRRTTMRMRRSTMMWKTRMRMRNRRAMNSPALGQYVHGLAMSGINIRRVIGRKSFACDALGNSLFTSTWFSHVMPRGVRGFRVEMSCTVLAGGAPSCTHEVRVLVCRPRGQHPCKIDGLQLQHPNSKI